MLATQKPVTSNFDPKPQWPLPTPATALDSWKIDMEDHKKHSLFGLLTFQIDEITNFEAHFEIISVATTTENFTIPNEKWKSGTEPGFGHGGGIIQ